MNIRFFIIWILVAVYSLGGYSQATMGIGNAVSDTSKEVNLEASIRKVIKNKKAQVGVAVILNGKDTIIINNDRPYPMMSVFKSHQALAVANYLQQNNLPLSTEINITKEDLKTNTYSPLRDKFPEGNISLPISELLAYTLQLSDNNACDILFNYIGGPKVADDYIRSLGIEQFAIVATEDDMHKDMNVCYNNWSSPLEAARLMEILLTRKLFNDDYQEFIKRTLTECETGKNRLAQPLQGTEAIIGHKTGTGDRNAKGQLIGTNDIGFVPLPNGNRYTIAVFVKDSEESKLMSSQIIADISEMVYRQVK
ncbi:MAG: class A beta-lactamase, subclass A2 [Bacteroides sp.]|nr:class A beta-lactamase, subclass A2 [Bacteroides sp.]